MQHIQEVIAIMSAQQRKPKTVKSCGHEVKEWKDVIEKEEKKKYTEKFT